MMEHQMRSLQKKRTTNFREDETKLLIQLWGSPQIQNKLYLTHRKEPVMRLLAHNMQQRGFFRTPDEIKTRIRNLKCLYHRIKRTVQSGSGIGTVDPDWPHYKAMDNILSKQTVKKDIYKENVFEGPRCEDIKQEIDDIDINDDMESYTTNSMGGSEYEDESMPHLTPAPKPTTRDDKNKLSVTPAKFPTILPNITITNQANSNNTNSNSNNGRPNNLPSIPFPLLILNGLPSQNQDKNKGDNTNKSISNSEDVSNILKELLEVQKENLDIEKQRLELDKQRMEFEKFVGAQLLALAPAFSGLLQTLSQIPDLGQEEIRINNNKRKRGRNDKMDFLQESKILRTLLGDGIKKILTGNNCPDDESENEDSGIQHDDNSNCSTSTK